MGYSEFFEFKGFDYRFIEMICGLLDMKFRKLSWFVFVSVCVRVVLLELVMDRDMLFCRYWLLKLLLKKFLLNVVMFGLNFEKVIILVVMLVVS